MTSPRVFQSCLTPTSATTSAAWRRSSALGTFTALLPPDVCSLLIELCCCRQETSGPPVSKCPDLRTLGRMLVSSGSRTKEQRQQLKPHLSCLIKPVADENLLLWFYFYMVWF